jgi:para-nitrobenzyl esterase
MRIGVLGLIVSGLLASTVHAAGAAGSCVAPSGGTVVCTESGAVGGTASAGVLGFKGIPYAKPPLGALRWRPPEPAEPWDGLREAASFGPACPQLDNKGAVVGNEDCLTLNVWTPSTAPARPLPVMIWLTGGGNHSLSGAGSPGFGGVVYDGTTMASRGDVVFVSFNIRLGALGFLAHPALDRESERRVSGNYGSLDQIAMLSWVRRNIAGFGGDPARVFLFGTSAGGGNICALMTSPLARGLFHGASMQSSVPTSCEIQTLAEMEAGTGTRVAAALGCAGDAAGACLRGKTTEEIVRAVPGTFTVFPRIYGPNVDGWIFPDQPLKRIAEKKHQAMPVILGTTAEETMQFVNAAGPVTDAASYAAAVEKVFGSGPRDAILAHYPIADYASPRAAFVAATTDGELMCTTRKVARTLAAAQSEPVWRYVFTHFLANDPEERKNGSIHTVEHPFFFGWQGRYVPSGADRGLQEAMLLYWSRMAWNGNPNGPGTPDWPAYQAAADSYLELAPGPRAGGGWRRDKCDFWDGVAPPWPHL